MGNDFKKFKELIREIIGEKALDRVFEVANILEIEWPQTINICGISSSGWISNEYTLDKINKDSYERFAMILSNNSHCVDYYDYLDGDKLDKLGYFKFSKYHQEIVFIKDDIAYHWYKDANDVEIFSISKDHRHNYKNEFSVYFNKKDKGINTSNMVFTGLCDFPRLHSYITKVESHDTTIAFKQEVPIEQYFELFKNILNDRKFSYIIPDSLHQEHLIRKIEELFKGPINELVFDILNNDQSWRYEKEEENIIYDCEYTKRKAKEEYAKVVNEAEKIYQCNVQKAENNKDARLQDLEIEFEEYKSSKKGFLIK